MSEEDLINYSLHVARAQDAFGRKDFADNHRAIAEKLRQHEDLVEALEEARKQIIEVCQSTGTPLPEASIERYDAALKQARGES